MAEVCRVVAIDRQEVHERGRRVKGDSRDAEPWAMGTASTSRRRHRALRRLIFDLGVVAGGIVGLLVGLAQAPERARGGERVGDALVAAMVPVLAPVLAGVALGVLAAVALIALLALR